MIYPTHAVHPYIESHPRGSPIQDVFNNYVTPIPSFAAMHATAFGPDTVPPTVVYYRLDMAAMAIFLRFSESVTLRNIDLSQLIMQNTPLRRYGLSRSFGASTAAVGLGSNRCARRPSHPPPPLPPLPSHIPLSPILTHTHTRYTTHVLIHD